MSVKDIILGLMDFYGMLIIVYVLMSLFRPSSGILYDAYVALGTVVEPWVGIFRRIVPLFGMIDFSPLVAILVLRLIQRLLSSLL
ncbi:MAG: YggT family protein [Coriobacteriia bacterium]|nr:YggT family protein [Coriobacteriia bacterium]